MEIKESIFQYKRVNGLTWLEFASQIMGYENFSYKGKQVYKYELFWAGVKPVEVIFKKNGFSCEKRKFFFK
jgi:hypothetical protein